MQIIWTNCQGLFMVGLFIVGAYWVECLAGFFRHKTGRPLQETALLAFVAASCLVNPYGIAGALLPFGLLSRIAPLSGNIYSLNISENVPLLSLTGFETAYRTLVIATGAAAVALFVLNRKVVRLAHLLLFAGVLALAFAAVRNVPLYVVIVVPLIGRYAATVDCGKLSNILQPDRLRLLSRVVYVGMYLVLLVPLYRHASVVALCPPGRALSPFRFPEKITEHLKSNPVPGNVFNDIRYGGYLAWHLYPEKKVFIDTRLVLRSPEFFAEYLAISDYPDLFFTSVAEKFNITHAVLPSALFTRHLKLIRWLYLSSAWRLAYTDGASVFFVRSDVALSPGLDLSNAAVVRAIADSIGVRWKNTCFIRHEALCHFADLLENLEPCHAVKTIPQLL